MDIYDIIYRSLIHKLDGKEKEMFDQWMAESEENRKLYQSFLAKDDVVEQYRQYMNFDEDEAWQKLQPALHANEKHQTSKLHLIYNIGRILPRRYVGRAVAAAVGILLVWGSWKLYQVNSPVAPQAVPVSQEIAIAMQKAESSTVNEAIIQIGDEKPQQVKSLSAWLKSMAQKEVDDTEMGTITTRYDKEFWTTLPDGTHVHLNGNSRISYPLSFKGDIREVALVGEAYFIVAKDKQHPFIVHTKRGDIKEYGTEFNVNATNEQTSVVLVSGSISVIPTAGKERMMIPGEKAEISLQGVSLNKVDVAPYIAWNTGQFSFDDCTLEELMQVVGKWYGREIVFDADRLRKVRFTGSLSRYESIDNTLEVVSTIANVKIKQVENKIVIL